MTVAKYRQEESKYNRLAFRYSRSKALYQLHGSNPRLAPCSYERQRWHRVTQQKVGIPRSPVLPFSPHENKCQQPGVRRVRNRFGDLETHVARFPEEAASDPTVGLSDGLAGSLIDELKLRCQMYGPWCLSVSTYHNL